MFSIGWGELQVLDGLLVGYEDVHIGYALLDVAASRQQPSHPPWPVPTLVQLYPLSRHVLIKLLQPLQLPRCVGSLRPSLEEQSANPLPLSNAEIISSGRVVGPEWAKEKCLLGDVGVVADGVELSVHLKPIDGI
jgi:hypothetical protein